MASTLHCTTCDTTERDHCGVVWLSHCITAVPTGGSVVWCGGHNILVILLWTLVSSCFLLLFILSQALRIVNRSPLMVLDGLGKSMNHPLFFFVIGRQGMRDRAFLIISIQSSSINDSCLTYLIWPLLCPSFVSGFIKSKCPGVKVWAPGIFRYP